MKIEFETIKERNKFFKEYTKDLKLKTNKSIAGFYYNNEIEISINLLNMIIIYNNLTYLYNESV